MHQQNNTYLRQDRIIVIAMTSLFKRLFWKKKESNSMNLKNVLMEKIEYFKYYDHTQYITRKINTLRRR